MVNKIARKLNKQSYWMSLMIAVHCYSRMQNDLLKFVDLWKKKNWVMVVDYY